MNERILIIRFGSLGDIILTSSAVLNIRCNFPDSSIIYLTKEKYRSVVEMIDGVDEIVTIGNSISTPAYFKFLLKIDSQYDFIFDLHGNFRSWMARKILTANQTVIYPKRRIERALLVKNKEIPASYPHTIDLYNQTLLELEKIAYQHRPVIKTKSINDKNTEKFFKHHKQVIVFAPGASYQTKQYPPEKFADAAVQLHKQNGSAIIWAEANSEDYVPQFLSEISESSFLLLTNLPIQELASVIENAQLTIANDSGIAHLSSAVNTPVIALFGPTHPALGFAPRGMFDQVIHVKEECRPCSLHGSKSCYRDSQFCFDRIKPERIVNLAKHKLEQSMMSEKAVFLDRDGTIIKDENYLSDPNDIEIIDGAVEALKNLQENNYKLVVVSNQSGVARGKFGIEDVEKVNLHLSEMLAKHNVFIDAFYYCPHHPNGTVAEFSGVCQCRKPSTGMVEEAVYQLAIDPRKSFVIGDKLADLHLGKLMGGKSILVRTGYGKEEEKFVIDSLYYNNVAVCDNIKTAGEIILKG